ncbi:LRR receptor-like serine/threonine-protein kinase EFR [Triticum aestivum]|uniref:LRR receptor-like serine/threonine-protein kinase EFR n=1 Tax=Triticum aestivum TaxID=4565 RepID=UPI001D02BDCA|nr:LRR receptor-like serine/threonine-protein kinase EFR [Triticum aestivum]
MARPGEGTGRGEEAGRGRPRACGGGMTGRRATTAGGRGERVRFTTASEVRRVRAARPQQHDTREGRRRPVRAGSNGDGHSDHRGSETAQVHSFYRGEGRSGERGSHRSRREVAASSREARGGRRWRGGAGRSGEGSSRRRRSDDGVRRVEAAGRGDGGMEQVAGRRRWCSVGGAVRKETERRARRRGVEALCPDPGGGRRERGVEGERVGESGELAMASAHNKRPRAPAILLLLALLQLYLGGSKINCATLPDNNTDVLWLPTFRHGISSDPSGWFSSWNSSANHCLWRVVVLEHFGLNLAGQISSSIGNLTFLRTVNQSTNGFSGRLPPMNHLQKLEVLDLSVNRLHDSISDAIINCSSLREIDLNTNFLVGEIPPKVGLLSNLSLLRLCWNNLTGIIPPILGNITSIQRLGLAYNNLTGRIPNEFGKLTNVWRLNLGGNRLLVGFPWFLFNLSKSLQILGLESNMLNNTLPPTIGNDLPNLQELYLNSNMFEGQIPASLGNATWLQTLELGNNNFTGEITSSLGKLSKLHLLYLGFNNLEAIESQIWEFFSALTNCTSLEALSLYENQLHGAIPNTIGNFSRSLTKLYLGRNNLLGKLPPSIGNLGSLFSLVLEDNNLTGTNAQWIGKLTQLQILSLQANSFIGTLPSSLGQLTQLTYLDLGNNKLGGPIPPALGNLKQLSLLDLGQNNLEGNIPIQVGSLTSLYKLALSSNNLTSKIY